MSRDAIKLALEALENSRSLEPVDVQWVKGKRHAAITALRKALAEQPCDMGQMCLNCQPRGPNGECPDKQPAQQEPVAWMDIDENGTFSGLRYWSESDNRHEVALYTSPPAQQEPVLAIRLLTNQCFALIQERDELQKQVWRYEKNGVTCQTYRHKVDASCSECNVHEFYTSPPAQRKPLSEEWIRSRCGQTWVFEAAKQWVRLTEAAHNIKENT